MRRRTRRQSDLIAPFTETAPAANNVTSLAERRNPDNADERAVDQLVERCARAGLRASVVRRAILTALHRAPAPCTVDEIRDAALLDTPGVTNGVVYRFLNPLERLDMVARFPDGRGKARYCLQDSTPTLYVQHEGSSALTPIQDSEIEKSLRAFCAAHGLDIVRQDIRLIVKPAEGAPSDARLRKRLIPHSRAR